MPRFQSRENQVFEWNENTIINQGSLESLIQNPPSFFENLSKEIPAIQPIEKARVLLLLGDSVTTDHISPAGAFKEDTPAGKYLVQKNISPENFNSYGSRRGNDRIMTRGTFANIRIKNQLAPNTEGGFTTYFSTGEVMSIFEAAEKYKEENTPLIVIAGTEYGTGSSRDWAAKGSLLLGIKAVIASSFERIHRSNLIGMGVLPLQFLDEKSFADYGISGKEIFSLSELNDDLQPQQQLNLKVDEKSIPVLCRLDTPVELEYYRNQGILHNVLRNFIKESV